LGTHTGSITWNHGKNVLEGRLVGDILGSTKEDFTEVTTSGRSWGVRDRNPPRKVVGPKSLLYALMRDLSRMLRGPIRTAFFQQLATRREAKRSREESKSQVEVGKSAEAVKRGHS